MDPNATLSEMLNLANDIEAKQDIADDADVADELIDDAARLAELVKALDEWIVGGGFVPQRWSKKEGNPGCPPR